MARQWEAAGAAAADAGLWQWQTVMRTTCSLLLRASPDQITAISQVLLRLELPAEERFVQVVGQRLASEYGLGFDAEVREHTISIRFFRLTGETGQK